MDITTNKGYGELQKGIDLLISKFGIDKTVGMITQLSGNASFEKDTKQKSALLITFMISESKTIFDWKERTRICEDKQYKEGRMACYHIFKTYTDMSYRQMGKHFDQGKRGVLYHVTKCEELLSIPNYHKLFVTKYRRLEENTIHFISTINQAT